MTGFGDARGQNDRLSVSIEVRAVNNRYFKLVSKTPERYQSLEGEIERIVRESISRGTVNLSIRVNRAGSTTAYKLDAGVLEGYWKQLTGLTSSLGVELPDSVASLLSLPGVVSDSDASTTDPREDWPEIEPVLREALARFSDFRTTEGASMEQDLQSNLRIVSTELEKVATRAPQIVREFRDKLLDRVRELLREGEAKVEPNDLIREVSVYAERCDISEEIVRLRSHLEQFQSFVRQSQSPGRKLDFLTQEMVREVNTIGSKANNVEVAHAVVEIKAAVERMREVLQNVE
jgi:uncharacterized protein (TIGR00255 family)